MQGTVKWFAPRKGFGVITAKDNREDYFVHQSRISMDGFRHLRRGDIVDFDVTSGENGRNLAVNVRPVLTMQMVEDSLKEENLYVKRIKADKNTVIMNAVGMKKGYMAVDQNGVIRAGENGMTFLELAAFAGYDTEGLSE